MLEAGQLKVVKMLDSTGFNLDLIASYRLRGLFVVALKEPLSAKAKMRMSAWDYSLTLTGRPGVL